MGLQLDMGAFQESPEEREQRARAAMRRRILIIGSLLVFAIIARVVIKDPPPPKQADYSKDQIRYVPGMLDAIPASQRAKLDPKIVAKMIAADEASRLAKLNEGQTLFAKGPYKPAEATIESDLEALKYKDQLANAVKKRRTTQGTFEPQADMTKPMLVRFQRGGYIKAEKATSQFDGIDIRYNRTLMAHMPRELILSVSSDGLTWEEPVPAGFVRVRPAKGITITVSEETAKRISVKKVFTDET